MLWFPSVCRLEERIEKLEHDLKGAMLDFDELYAKCRKLLGRTVKERAKMEELGEAQEAGSETPSANGSGLLTPKQRLIQQQILQRRAKL